MAIWFCSRNIAGLKVRTAWRCLAGLMAAMPLWSRPRVRRKFISVQLRARPLLMLRSNILAAKIHDLNSVMICHVNAAALDNKDIQFLTLKNADHFYNTLYYNHQSEFYTKMLDFLANDCGPGGL